MSQTGSTAFLRVSSVGSVPIFSDTFIDENNGASNASTADPVLFSATSNQVKAIIFDITVPDKKDLVDSSGNKLPDDVIFSSADIRLRVSGAPGTNTQVRGYILTTAASISDVDWNTQDGSTLWYPDQYGETDGDGDPLKVVHGEIVINQNMNPSDDTDITLNMFNLRKKQADVDFGKNFQIIVYASVASAWGVHSSNHTSNTDHCPHLKIHYIKPAPDPATITVTPDSFGHDGTVNITKPTSDKNLQQYSLAYKTSSGVAQTDNTTDITDIGTKSIPLTDLTQAAASGTPAYAKRWPFSMRSTTYFKLFSEDLYNTNTNATPSNEVQPRIRPNVGVFKSYNSAGAYDYQPEVGEEMTLRLDVIDVYGKISEYAINFDVESSLVDTGITWNATSAPHGGTSWTNTASDAAYTKLFNSDPDAFTLGETLKITSDAGSEFVIVVGEDNSNGFTVVKRGQLNTAAVSHTGLADTTKIYKVNYDDFYFVKTPSLPNSLSVKHTFSKSGDKHTNHVALIIKDENGWASFPGSLNGTTGVVVGESNPIAKLTSSRTKVPYAKYGDQTAGLTLSLSNSSAVGSNREIIHNGFTYNAFLSDTVATANALSNNNKCFETSSKRVQLVSTGSDSLTDSTWRIFGLTSVASDGSNLSDGAAGFSHYEYSSEKITVGARLTPVSSAKYWKNIECVVCEEVDSDDDGNRFLLMVHPDDLTRHTASTLNEGDTITDDLTAGETGVTVVDSSLYKAGDVVVVGDDPKELMLITSIDSSTTFTVRRGYLFTTAEPYNDGINIFLAENKNVKQIFVNKELRAKAKYNDSNFATEYMWGGFARIKATDIDFDSNNLMGLDGVDSNSSFNDTDWYANGFAPGDVIKLQSNKTANGTYAAPGYYKILDIVQTGGSGDYDYVYVAEHTNQLSDDEATYVSTSFATQTAATADIVRYDNARNPAMTVAVYNYGASSNAYTGNADSLEFKGFVMDDDTSDFITNRNEDTIMIRAVGLSTLDLDALASTGDIAILNYNLGRNGGASAVMPLGDRRYPIGGTNSSLGMLSMTINIRVLTQTGYQAIFSLIEGDRYDYAFLDGVKVDNPNNVYKSYRMKLNGGQITKDPEMASQYLASLTMLVMGEDVS